MYVWIHVCNFKMVQNLAEKRGQKKQPECNQVKRGRWLQAKYLKYITIARSGLETLLCSCTVYLPLLPPPRLLAAEWFLHKQTIVLHFRVTHVKVCTHGRATSMVGGALVGHGSVSQLVQMQKEQLVKHSEPVRHEPHLHKVEG